MQHKWFNCRERLHILWIFQSILNNGSDRTVAIKQISSGAWKKCELCSIRVHLMFLQWCEFLLELGLNLLHSIPYVEASHCSSVPSRALLFGPARLASWRSFIKRRAMVGPLWSVPLNSEILPKTKQRTLKLDSERQNQLQGCRMM